MTALRPKHPALPIVGRVVLAAATAAALVGGCGPAGDACGPTTAVVASVIDGDTIVLEGGEKVRYLLVDTPEITKGKNDCYGHEAFEYNSALVSGKTITLAYDPAACTDRYGRLLAYVSIAGREVNPLLVERGYACADYIPPAGGDRCVEFKDLEQAARDQNRGLWGACETVTCLHSFSCP